MCSWQMGLPAFSCPQLTCLSVTETSCTAAAACLHLLRGFRFNSQNLPSEPRKASVGRPGSRRDGLLGAWCPAFCMETVRKCYVSRLQPSLCFSTFSHNRPTFFFFFNPRWFFPSNPHLQFTLITHIYCSTVASAAFHTFPRVNRGD